MYVCASWKLLHVCWCPWRPTEVIRSPEIGVTDICEPPSECRELKPDPLGASGHTPCFLNRDSGDQVQVLTLKAELPPSPFPSLYG